MIPRQTLESSDVSSTEFRQCIHGYLYVFFSSDGFESNLETGVENMQVNYVNFEKQKHRVIFII